MLLHFFCFVFRYGKGSFSFGNLISGVTKRFSTEFELLEVCCPSKATKYHNSCKCPCWGKLTEIYIWLKCFLCSFLASAIQRRQPPCWFWLWHLGLGAGYRENHGQHQMGCWEQRTRAEVALRWDCMRKVHLSKHRLTNRLFRTVVKDAKLTLDWPDVTS